MNTGAYPTGDAPQYWSEMGGVDGLKPYPNSVLWNWATIFILGFGNLSAIDFQVSVHQSSSYHSNIYDVL
jgi:hypothetical protein